MNAKSTKAIEQEHSILTCELFGLNEAPKEKENLGY